MNYMVYAVRNNDRFGLIIFIGIGGCIGACIGATGGAGASNGSCGL
jgi:hypothetical protein